MFNIVSDIGADLPQSLISGLTVITQPVELNGAECTFDPSSEQQMRDFYRQIAAAKSFATRAMTYDEFYEPIMRLAVQSDLLCLSFSQRLSGTGAQMQRVCQALDGHPNRVTYFDTQTATLGQGVLAHLAICCRNQGKTLPETVEILQQARRRLQFYVLLDSSSNFFKGGRCATLNGRLFPLLKLPLNDLYKQVGSFFTREACFAFLQRKLAAQPNSVIFIGHGSNVGEAQQLAVRWHNFAPIVGTCYANPVMGVHTGDNALLVAFLQV